MSEPASAIEVRRPVEVMAERASTDLFRSSDPTERIQEAIEKADVLGRVIERLGLAKRFGESERAFLMLPAWQVLTNLFGLSLQVEETKPLPDKTGFWARAICVAPDGRLLGAGEAMCERSEANWRRAPNHNLLAMAQTRALRRAAQATLGVIPALAGLDVSDPNAPATRKQVKALHTIASKLGWSKDERHERAGVDSLNDLTVEQAGELFENWSAMLQDVDEERAEVETPVEQLTDLADLWRRAIDTFGSKVNVLREWCSVFNPDARGVSAAQVSVEELRFLLTNKDSSGENQEAAAASDSITPDEVSAPGGDSPEAPTDGPVESLPSDGQPRGEATGADTTIPDEAPDFEFFKLSKYPGQKCSWVALNDRVYLLSVFGDLEKKNQAIAKWWLDRTKTAGGE